MGETKAIINGIVREFIVHACTRLHRLQDTVPKLQVRTGQVVNCFKLKLKGLSQRKSKSNKGP